MHVSAADGGVQGRDEDGSRCYGARGMLLVLTAVRRDRQIPAPDRDPGPPLKL